MNNVNNDPNRIAELYGNTVDAATLAKIQNYAEGGFTNDELFELEEEGVDISLLKTTAAAGADEAGEADAADAADGAEGAKAGTATKETIDKKIAELKEKYAAEAGGGDPYSMNNPQMQKFKQAIDDGVLKDLAAAGLDKLQIVDVISEVFPSIGIGRGDNGGYTLPMGHDTEASELYNKFSNEIAGIANANVTADTKALNDKLAALNAQIQANDAQIAILKPMIQKVQKDVEARVDDAIEKSEKIAEDQKEAAKTAVSNNLKKYTDANGEMSYSKFRSNLDSDLGEIASDGDNQLKKVVNEILDAEAQLTALKGYVGKMATLVQANQDLQAQVGDVQGEIEDVISDAENASSEAGDCEAQRCDPIGFATADGTRYDFFVDNDGDGKLSNEKEFLGAENGWEEMANLDTSGDGKVTGDEMKNLKVVVTHADGTQEIKDASEIFDEAGEAIDVNSYKELNQEMDNGNALLGTFSVNVNGEEINDGYNTLDTLDWLDANYDFSDKDRGINRFEKDQTVEAVEAKDYSADLQALQNKNVEIEGKIKQAWSNLGIEREDLAETIEGALKAEGEEKAKVINEKIQKGGKMPEVKEEAPAENAPVEDGGDAPAENAPVDEAPVEDAPEEAPVEDGGDAPVDNGVDPEDLIPRDI